MMNSQSELTIERSLSFIGLPTVEIRGVYLELNQSEPRVPSGARVRGLKLLTRSLHFKSRVSRVASQQQSRTTSPQQIRVASL